MPRPIERERRNADGYLPWPEDPRPNYETLSVPLGTTLIFWGQSGPSFLIRFTLSVEPISHRRFQG